MPTAGWRLGWGGSRSAEPGAGRGSGRVAPLGARRRRGASAALRGSRSTPGNPIPPAAPSNSAWNQPTSPTWHGRHLNEPTPNGSWRSGPHRSPPTKPGTGRTTGRGARRPPGRNHGRNPTPRRPHPPPAIGAPARADARQARRTRGGRARPHVTVAHPAGLSARTRTRNRPSSRPAPPKWPPPARSWQPRRGRKSLSATAPVPTAVTGPPVGPRCPRPPRPPPGSRRPGCGW